jgi:large subunit ribosomal protein L30
MPKRTASAATAKPKRATRKPRVAAPVAEASAVAEEGAAGGAARSGGLLRVRQVRSGIGHAATYRRTLRALGLKHHQDVVVRPDTPSLRGMIRKVRHLVQVTSAEG